MSNSIPSATDFPRLVATFTSDTEADFNAAGTSHALQAEDEDTLRELVIDRAAQISGRLNRNVKLHVSQTGIETVLEVGPDSTFEVLSENVSKAPKGAPTQERPAAAPQQSAPMDQPTEEFPAPAEPLPVPPQQEWALAQQATPPPAQPQSAPTPPPAPAFAWAGDPEWQQIQKQPAEHGWRSFLKLSPGEAELQERQAQFSQRKEEEAERERIAEQQRLEAAERRRLQEQQDAEEISRKQALMERRQAHKAKLNRTIQTNFQGTRTILVANPKGGARKTTTTYILGAMIGSTRGGSTIAWDANETMGTLGERAQTDRHHRTVVDLLEDGAQHFLDIDSARVGILDAYVRNQGDCHFDVLASDENPSRQDQIDAAGFQKVHDILSHFYRMILVDTGNNIRAEHFVEAQKHADQLVIPVAASHDSKNRALDMMAAFSAAGYDHLVAHAVVLVHELEKIDRDDNGQAVSNESHELTAAEIAAAFDGRVKAVLPIPYDPKLKDGGQIEYFQLSPSTISAYREAAAALSDSLIDRTLKTGRHGQEHASGESV